MWRYFFFGLVVTAIVVGALELVSAQLVTVFFGSEFTEAIPIARILLLGTLFMAARRVLTDGTNGIGRPGLGTLAEIASWVVLLPAIAILLPPYGVTGVAWALTIAWGFSLVFLLAAVIAIGTPIAAAAGTSVGTLTRVGRRSVARFRAGMRSARRHALRGIGVVAVCVAAGAAVALGPFALGIGLTVAVIAAVLFAFGRLVLAPKLHRDSVGAVRQAALALGPGRPPSENQDGTEFRVARFLYYGGLLLIGFLTLRAGGQAALSDVLFLFSLLFTFAELILVRRVVPIRIPMMLLVGMCLFSTGALLSTFESYAYVSSTAIIVRLIFLTVFWFWLGTIVLTCQRHVMTGMTIWVASAAMGGVGAMMQLALGDVIPGTTPVWGRGTGFTTHPNELGGLTAIALVPALMLAAREGLSLRHRLFSYVLLLLVGAGLILSGSVSALLAAAVAIFVWFSLGRHSRKTLRVYAVIGICACAVIAGQSALGGQTPLDRLERVTNSNPDNATEGAGSLESRIVTYESAIKHIKKQPFLGVGLDLLSITKPFGIESDDYDVHNVIIGTWYKTGLFGLIGMMWVLIVILTTGWRVVTRADADVERAAALALVCSVLAFIVFAMGQPVLYSRFGWISAALLLALRAVQSRSVESARVRARPRPMENTGLVLVEQGS